MLHALRPILLAISMSCAMGAATAATMEETLSQTTSVHWQQVPLREALTRLGTTFDLVWFLDRRVDPEKWVSLMAENQSIATMLDELATQNQLSVFPMGSTLYVGPPGGSAQLLPLLEGRQRRQAGGANKGAVRPSLRLRKTLAKSGTTEWPRLAEPRGIVEQMLKEARVKVTGTELLPHDIWPVGELPNMPLSDRLDLLLVGFDLVWQFTASGKQIEIVRVEPTVGGTPVPKLAALIGPKENARKSSKRKKPAKSPSRNEQRYTLRIQDQRLSDVLRQIAKSVKLELQIEPAAMEAAESRVSVSVNQATLAELVEELTKSAGLHGSVEAERIVVQAVK